MLLKDFKYLLKTEPNKVKSIIYDPQLNKGWFGIILQGIAEGKSTRVAYADYQKWFLANVLPHYAEPAFSEYKAYYDRTASSKEIQSTVRTCLQIFNHRYKKIE